MKVVLGAGLAGLGAGLGLLSQGDGDFMILERSPRVGGLAGSIEKQGWVFDHTGHFLHMRDLELQDFLSSLVELAPIERRAAVYYKGRFVPYPFQSNLAFLDEDEVVDLLLGAIDAHCQRPMVKSFRDWIIASVGERIADVFLIPYNRKLYGVDLEQLAPEQGGKYIPKVQLADILRGAVSQRSGSMGYNASFLYPVSGGIQAVPDAFAAFLDGQLRLNQEVTAISPERREVHLKGGQVIPYEPPLLSSIPLPTLLRMLLPGETKRACEGASATHSLRATRILALNVAVRGRLRTPYHWIYVPDDTMPFYRIGSQTNVSASNAPQGCSSLWAEINVGQDSAMAGGERNALIDWVIESISTMGLISRDAKIEFVEADDIWPGYVLFDRGQAEVVERIRQVLRSAGIETIGRYGRWAYLSMEESIVDGLKAAGASTGLLRRLSSEHVEDVK